MRGTRLALTMIVALIGPCAFAAGLAGTWTLTSEGRQGTNTSELTVAATEDGHTGSLAGRRGTAELQSVAVDGDSFSFTVTMETRMGNFDLEYKGTVSGDTLTGTIETPMGDRPFKGTRKE